MLLHGEHRWCNDAPSCLQCAAIMEQHEQQQQQQEVAAQPPASPAGRALTSTQSLRKSATTPPSAAATEPAAQPADPDAPAPRPRTPPQLPQYGGLMALLATKGGAQVLQTCTSSEPASDAAAGPDGSTSLRSRPVSATSAADGATSSQQVMAWLGPPMDPSGRAPPAHQSAGGGHHGCAGQVVMDTYGTLEAAMGSAAGDEWHGMQGGMVSGRDVE
jgi:hypothetical protein